MQSPPLLAIYVTASRAVQEVMGVAGEKGCRESNSFPVCLRLIDNVRLRSGRCKAPKAGKARPGIRSTPADSGNTFNISLKVRTVSIIRAGCPQSGSAKTVACPTPFVFHLSETRPFAQPSTSTLPMQGTGAHVTRCNMQHWEVHKLVLAMPCIGDRSDTGTCIVVFCLSASLRREKGPC